MKFVLIGHPVAHSLSPVIQQAAYRELGETHDYQLVDAADEAAVEAVVAQLRSGELQGCNVTIPWKRRAFALADRTTALAQRLGVVNVLAAGGDGQLVGHNTDVPALAAELAEPAARTRRALVLGSGGATPAVIAACQLAGVAEVFVTARRFLGEQPAPAWPGAAELSALGAIPLAWPAASPQAAQALRSLLGDTGLVVQATSAGMQGADSGEPLAKMIDWRALPRHALAYDLVYAPLETPFLRAAREAGLRAEHGLSMLVGQAVLSVEIWLGRRPPAEPLLQAALAALARRSSS